MNDVQQKVAKLLGRGWTQQAIADELQVTWLTVHRWYTGETQPSSRGSVLMALDWLLKRKRIPKRRRYGKGSRQRNVGSEA